MNFEEYQRLTKKSKVYPKIGKMFVFPALGLAGETGEVLEKVKKLFRDGNGRLTKENKEEFKKEIGDVLWYVSQLSAELGLSLEDVAKSNVEKFKSRHQRGKVHGSGDNR
jgi:NTP pyrophosphatase (non-canonical NTP hydrolase)